MNLRFVALALLALASCSHAEQKPAAQPTACARDGETSSVETTSATMPAPQPVKARTLGADPYPTSAPTTAPAVEAPPAPPPPSNARQPGQFYPPTMPVNGNMNPSPPES